MTGVGLYILFSVIALGLLIMILLVILILSSEKKTVFSPDLEPEWIDPKELGAANDELEDVNITTEDDVHLYGWFYRTFLQKLIAKIQEQQQNRESSNQAEATKEETKANDLKEAKPLLGSPTVLYLHGNSGNISHRFPLLRKLADGTQFNIFVADYRGYGKSEGAPSEEGLKKDAEAMLHALLQRDDIDKERIIVYGQGIGGSLAIHLATQESTKKLFQAMVIENTFTSVHDMAAALIPSWLSVLTGLLKCQFDSLAALRQSKLDIPTLFIATSHDEVVPCEQMKQLYRTAKRRATPECKEYVKMICYEGTEHHNVPAINEEVFYRNLLDWSCKVLLHNSISEEEMQELEKQLMMDAEAEDAANAVEYQEDMEPIEPAEQDGDHASDDEDDADNDEITVVKKSELRKRVKATTDDNKDEKNDDVEAQD